MTVPILGVPSEELAPETVKPGWKILIEKATEALDRAVEVNLDPDQVEADPDQPRVFFPPESIARMADSLRILKQIQSGIVRKVEGRGKITHRLMDGERRWRGTKIVGIKFRAKEVDVEDDVAAFIIAAVANFNREGHTPTEISDSIAKMRRIGVPITEIAKMFGISDFWAGRLYGLQKLIPEVREMLDPTLPKNKILPVTGAIDIALAHPSLQLELAQKVIDRLISLSELRKKVVEASKQAGVHIRERRLEPGKQWRSLQNQSRSAYRAMRDLEDRLKSGGDEMLRSRTPSELDAVVKDLKWMHDAAMRCALLIKGARTS